MHLTLYSTDPAKISHGPHANFFLILFSLLSLILPFTMAQTSFSPTALVLPVRKDASTLLYLTNISAGVPLVSAVLTVHLGSQNLSLSPTYKAVQCNSAPCNLAGSKSCVTESFSAPKPGCNNNTCGVLQDNPVTNTCISGSLYQDVVYIQSTDGSNPGRVVSVPNFIISCSSTVLASGAQGIAGLGRTKISLPSQFSAVFGFDRQFAVCLSSSTSANGVVFFGDGPYNLRPGIDLSKNLIYTALILNKVSMASAYFEGETSSDYFIGVKSIKINGNTVLLNSTLLTINGEVYGGTKISTMEPFTVLETSIYNAVTNAFVKELTNVPRVYRAPFGAGFNSTNIGSTCVGPAVPQIDLVLHSNDVYWSIFGAKSMVRVKSDVLCLGFVDGGVNPRTSIGIGGHQLEDNLLQFDLATSSLGFSSSLLFRQSNRANFNFTQNA